MQNENHIFGSCSSTISPDDLKGDHFRLDHIWNRVLETDKSRPLVKRDYMYASEIGAAYIDRFLSMAAVPPSNPPNDRAVRKFKAGNIWEWIVWYTLSRAGIVKQYQGDRLVFQLPGCIEVSGRLDIVVAGSPNIEAGQKTLASFGLPDFFEDISNLLVSFSPKIRATVVEVKSVSAFMFERIIKTNKPHKHHTSQLYHYIRTTGLPGVLVYINKDDCQIKHFHIEPGDAYAEEVYRIDVEGYSRYYYANDSPPIENPLLWNDDLRKYEKNWRIEYSKYLTLVYGYESPQEYRDTWEPIAGRWNRVIERMKDGKDMTKDNEKALEEMANYRQEYFEKKRFFREIIIAA